MTECDGFKEGANCIALERSRKNTVAKGFCSNMGNTKHLCVCSRDRVEKSGVCERVESQHVPILFEITWAQEQSGATVTQPVERVVWHRDKMQDLIENIQGDLQRKYRACCMGD